MKQIKDFFVNKLLINLEQEKEQQLIEIESIEKERELFDNMSYKEKMKYKKQKNSGNIFTYTLLLEASILLFVPLFVVGGLVSLFFVNGFLPVLLNAFYIGICPFIVFFGLYFITFVIKNFIFLRPNFEKDLYYRIKSVYEISEQVSGVKVNDIIDEVKNADFSENEMLSWKTRNVLRKIIFSEKDIENMKKIGHQYELNLGQDLLDLYFLIKKNIKN